MAKITFIEPDGKEKVVEAEHGLSLLEVAHNNGIDLEGACEGSLACSTCQEEDMLDLAFGLTHTSRLGCQIIVDEKLDGMKVTIPSGTRNMNVE